LAEPDPTTDPTMDAKPASDAEDAPTAAYTDQPELVHEVVAGRYKLLQKIGEGGMGAVYRARQSEPVRRDVAVKIILPGMDSKQVLGRFEAERQALAMLDHPNIARVLDAGTTGRGQPFFAMELINGSPITQFCNERKLSVRQRLDLFIRVCFGIQHAHHKGIIHRDIKPSNVLVALYDDAAVPKVIDFGVAKATSQQLTDRTMFTQYGALVGTLEYMSPEQAHFNPIDIDTRTDVYSLGVLLYELLTGATPFERKRLRAAAFDEVLRIIREEEPQTPSRKLSTTEELATIAAERNLEPKRLGALVRGDLDWIVMKCLEKDRSRRYDSANALAADVQRYLNDEPISAGPPGTTYRLRKFLRRHRGPVFAAALLLVAVVTGTVVSISQAIRATRAEQLARANEKTAIEEREAAVKAGEGERKAREVAERFAVKASVENDLKQLEDDPAVGLLRMASMLDSIPPHLHEFRDVVVANILAWGQELSPLPALDHDGFDPVDAQLNDSGTLVLTRGADPTLRIWDPVAGTQKAVLKQFAAADFASFTKDGKSVVSFDNSERKVRVWNAEAGSRRFTSPVHRGAIRSVAFSSDGGKIATLSDLEGLGGDLLSRDLAGTVQVFDAKANRRLGQAFADPAMHAAFVMDPAGRFLITTFGDRAVRVFSIADRISSQEVSRPRGAVEGAFLSPSGRHFALLIANGERRLIACWETERWTPITQQELSTAVDSGGWIDDVTLALKSAAKGLSETLLLDRTPKLVRKLYAVLRAGNLILGENGEVYDARSGLLPSPRGRRCHPAAMDLAIKERWLGRKPVVDFATELDLGFGSLDVQAPVLAHSEPLYVGLNLKSLKRTLSQNPSASIPQSFVHLMPLPPFPEDAELISTYCRAVACGTLAANGKLVPDTRADWERTRLQLLQKLEALKAKIPPPARRILLAVCQDEAYWVRRQIPTADPASLDGLWKELLRVEPTWKNHLECAFFRVSSNQRLGPERLDHLLKAWRGGGSQYFDVVFDPLVETISETVTTSTDSKAVQGAETALKELLGEIRSGKRRNRLVAVAAMNAVRRKDLDEAMKFSAEYESFVLQDGRRMIVDAFRKFERERRGRTWDDYLATKQRACIARCLHSMVECLKKNRSAAEAALREADVLRKDLLDLARPEELRFQDFYDYAERLLREMKG
jgi:WD40 repeat protein